MLITINNITLKATLVDNSSTKALVKLLKQNPITIHMQDYANFEKVGMLTKTLPKNDEFFKTQNDMNIALEKLNYKINVYYDEIVKKEKQLLKGE